MLLRNLEARKWFCPDDFAPSGKRKDGTTVRVGEEMNPHRHTSLLCTPLNARMMSDLLVAMSAP